MFTAFPPISLIFIKIIITARGSIVRNTLEKTSSLFIRKLPLLQVLQKIDAQSRLLSCLWKIFRTSAASKMFRAFQCVLVRMSTALWADSRANLISGYVSNAAVSVQCSPEAPQVTGDQTVPNSARLKRQASPYTP